MMKKRKESEVVIEHFKYGWKKGRKRIANNSTTKHIQLWSIYSNKWIAHQCTKNHIQAHTCIWRIYPFAIRRWHYLYSKKSKVSRINSHNHNDVNGDMENALIYLIHFACYGWYHRWRFLDFVDMQLHVWIQLITELVKRHQI